LVANPALSLYHATRTLESESFMTAGLADAFLSVIRRVLQGKPGQEEIALVERS
jgi:hypothetical protein